METGQTPKTIPQSAKESAAVISVQEKIHQLNDLAWQLRIRDPERALSLSQEAAKVMELEAGHYEVDRAASLVTLSFLAGEAGRLDEALSQALRALTYLEHEPPCEILIGAWYTLGWAYFYSGDYPAALEFGLKSLKLARELKHLEWEGWCLDLTANAYKDSAQALQMHQEAFRIFERTGSLEGQSRILNNWAYTLMESKAYGDALAIAQQSLQLAKQGGLKRDEINIAATIGEIYTDMGDYTQAQAGLHDATRLFNEYGRDISSVYVLVDLGEVYLKQNDLERAEQQLLNALAASIRMEMRNEQARCHQYLSEIFEKQGRFDKALEHFKLFQALREVIIGESALKQLTALRMSHQIETAQRDAEIHRLQKEKLQIELDEHKRVHAMLEDLATRDSLTNLFNRRHFLNLAEQEWRRAIRYKHPLCALMLDLDDFKQINDQHGHAIGDQALITVANCLRSTLRSTEVAGRYGGDEFVILLPETLPQHGHLVANRICHAIAEQSIPTEAGFIELSSSIGAACASHEQPESPKSLDELLGQADKALYHAKRSGKGQVNLYSELK